MGTETRKLPEHIGGPQAPSVVPVRGPSLCEDCDVQANDGVQIEPYWGPAAQPAPNFDADQCFSG